MRPGRSLVWLLLALFPLVSVQGQGEEGETAPLCHEMAPLPAPAHRTWPGWPSTGVRPWLLILVHYSDQTEYTPYSVEYYQNLMGNQYPGLDHYWREQSYGALSTAGSKVVGFYTLPHPRSHYAALSVPLDAILDDGIAIAAADATRTFRFPDYFGLAVAVSDDREAIYGAGGGITVAPCTLDGVAKAYANACIPWVPDLFVLAHEFGHGFDLRHSSNMGTTRNPWDFMGGGLYHRSGEAVALPLGTIAWNKDFSGWIPASRKCIVTPGTTRTIQLERLAQPVNSTSYLMAQVFQSGVTTRYYTVEARRFAGYDQGSPLQSTVPGEGVVLYDVDMSTPYESPWVTPKLVQIHGSPNVYAQGTFMVPGDTFADAASGFSLSVDSQTATGYTVTITSDGEALPWVVTNTNDKGAGSLRNAVDWANLFPGTTVRFAIGSGAQTIRPASALPAITANGTFIDGTTQPGYAGKPLIEISGDRVSGNASGLGISAANCVLKGLAINRFTVIGVRVYGASATGNRIEGCYIGTNVDGGAAAANTYYGVLLAEGARNNVVGGTAAGAGNVISGNGSDGVAIADSGTSGNVIQGNSIGVDAAGTTRIANNRYGVAIGGGAQGNTVGGSALGAGNRISGNSLAGILVIGAGTNSNLIQGNFVGTNKAGTAAIANGWCAVLIEAGAKSNTIGGTAVGARNVLSGNTGEGVAIRHAGTDNNRVQGNYIGTDPTGSAALANGGPGVVLYGGPKGNTIGGTSAGQGNRIACNGQEGIRLHDAATTGNSARGNQVYSNGRLGINLVGGGESGAGVTANDSGDADTGPNNLQNCPTIISVVASGSGLAISGTLNSTPSRSFALDFFAGSTADASGYGEGELYLGSTTVSTDAGGSASFRYTATGSLFGKVFTATATDTTTGDTSEFSQAFAGPADPLASLTLNPSNVPGGTSALGTVTLSSPAPAGGVSVSLSSSAVGVANVAGPVQVAAGSSTGTFVVVTSPVSITLNVTITAGYGGSTRTATLAVQPPALVGLALDTNSVVGSTTTGGTVTLSAPAPYGGLAVGLSSDTPAKASVPATVIVPSGQTSAHFTITTGSVTASTPVVIRATRAGTTLSATLTLLPGTSRPDLLIKKGSDPDTAYAIAGTYQTAPAGAQVVSQEVAPATTATCQVKVVNAGTTNRSFVLRAAEAAGVSGWAVSYRVGATDISAALRSASGYTTPALAPGECLVVTVEATPAADVPGGTSLSVTLKVFLDATDTTVRDAVQAVATVSRPDLLVKTAAEATFAGDGLYQEAPAGAQVCRQVVPPAVKASYQVCLQNESGTARTFVLRAAETGSGWYVSYKVGTADFTTRVHSAAGFTTPTVPANGSLVVDVALTSLNSLPAGATKSATLRVFLNGSDTPVRDAVQAVAVVDRPRPDLLVKRGGEPDSAYASNNVYLPRPAGDQIERQTVVPGTAAVYHVKVQNDGYQARTYVLKAVETATAGWNVAYRLGGEEVSAQVKSTAGAATPEIAGGGQIVLTVEVTPGPAVLPNLRASVALNAFLDSADTTVRDAVQAVTTAGVLDKPDLMIKKASEASYLGDGLYQAVPAGAQVLSQAARATMSARTTVRVQNDGNTSRAFLVKALESDEAGWTTRYRYGATNITAQVKGAGWTTPVLTRCTGSTFLTVDLKPLAGTTGQKRAMLRVFLNGTDTVARDAVQAVAAAGLP